MVSAIGDEIATDTVLTLETRKRRDGTPYPDWYRVTCATGARYWGLPNAFGILKPVEKRRWVGEK